MKRIFKITFMVVALSAFLASCVKDLDTKPIDPNQMVSANVYSTPNGYTQVLAKLYAGLSVSGQQGPAGDPDISGIDEGFGQYTRGYWYHQELPTDEAVIGWNDQTIKDFHYQTWGSGDVFIAAMYYRIFFQISQCNEFIRESTDEKMDEYGIDQAARAGIATMRAEARFLRALSYWHALDLFGNVPFVTENDLPGKFFPTQITRANLFNYVESELLAIEPLLTSAAATPTGRASAAAAQTLLAKLYLNAEIYTGTAKNTECITYCNKVMAGGFTLEPVYKNLFMADNHSNAENIFIVEYDGLKTRTWGGTTFIIHAAVGGSMVPGEFGIDGGWGGTRTTKNLVQKFYPEITSKGLWSSPTPTKNVTEYPVLHVPGSYQGWDPTKNNVIASVGSNSQYEGYLYLPADAEFKFTLGTTWDINWGGENGVLSHGGANLKVTEDGYYKINVDTAALTYTVIKTTWGVIGDATPGGWDSDTPMTYDETTDTWSVIVDLEAKELKFRANGGWDINYGSNGGDGILQAGGSNIAVGAAGTYILTMKLGVPDYTYTIVAAPYDRRAMFWSDGQSLEINDIGTFTDGYAITKFSNLRSDGGAGQDLTYCDTDFPMFRLADVYLMYAEAVLRGGSGGDLGTALNLVNQILTRAYNGSTGGNITADQLTLDFILDERARELFWEGHRRTDLIRYGRFSATNYLWPWKGGVPDGISTSSNYNLFPLPSSDVSANPNLKQNPGY